jgi:hypothetical protein
VRAIDGNESQSYSDTDCCCSLMGLINESKISKLTEIIMWCGLVTAVSLNYRVSRVELNTAMCRLERDRPCRALQLNNGTDTAEGMYRVIQSECTG